MRRVYLMRHGDTLYEGQESPDGSDLTPEGRRQAGSAAALLREVKLDAVYASPMRRARGTAEIIAAQQSLEVVIVPELVEILPGSVEGRDIGGIFSEVIGFFSGPGTGWDTPFLGGETFRQVRERVSGFFQRLLARGGWSQALLVAHGGVNNALLSWILETPEGEILRLEQDLACINIIDCGVRPAVRLLNLTPYDLLKVGLQGSTVDRLAAVMRERMGGG